MAPNGNPALIEGYDAESTVPYFMRHKVEPVRSEFARGPVQRPVGTPGVSGAVDQDTVAAAREVYRVLSNEQAKGSGPLA